jgi:hypothetical protein
MPIISLRKKAEGFCFYFFGIKKKKPKLESHRCKATSIHGSATAIKAVPI